MFLKISEAANLALHAMAFLAGEDPASPVRAATVSANLKVSETHLVKVLQRLKKAGLVNSVRGPGGGYILSRDTSKIRLLDVYEAIDGRFVADECLLNHRVCDRQKCIFGNLLSDVGTIAYNNFSKTTLAMLVETAGPHEAGNEGAE